jgi:hypothetical protein
MRLPCGDPISLVTPRILAASHNFRVPPSISPLYAGTSSACQTMGVRLSSPSGTPGLTPAVPVTDPERVVSLTMNTKFFDQLATLT